MPNNIYGKKAILSGALTLAILTSACATHDEDVVVKMKEKKEDSDVKPTIEVEEATWVQFDESALMYKVNLNRFLTDKLKLSKDTLNNKDIINLLGIIQEELGQEIYTKDKGGNELCNLDGKSLLVNSCYNQSLRVMFYDFENLLEYEVKVSKDGSTKSTSRSRKEGIFAFSKYYVIYSDGNEFIRAICLRESNEKYITIGIHEDSGHFDSYNISFDTDIGEASIKLSKEEYDALYGIMLSYSDSDNLYGFLSDNTDLLNKYLDLIKEKNAEYYEYLCSLISGYIEKPKNLHYE